METILIVDDEAFIRENVQRILSEDGYRVLEAANGQQALEIIAGDEIDLTLLDLNLEPDNGLTLLKIPRGTLRYKMEKYGLSLL